jgi:hypothetical protein
LTKKKPGADSISAAAQQLYADIDTAISSAFAKGVPIYRVIDALEQQENAARHRLAAAQMFEPRVTCGNVPD